jgi:hypothetical protein
VRREDQKDKIQKPCSIVLDYRLDLQQLYNNQDLEFFTKQGIKVGIAQRFIHDIGYWVEQQMRYNAGTSLIKA